MITLSIKLKELREEKKLKQTELCEELHIAYGSYNKWEYGAARPSYEDLIMFANYYKVSIDYLLGREDEFGHVNIVISPDMALTKDEHNLLVQYKNLSDIDKKRLLQIADTFVEKQ